MIVLGQPPGFADFSRVLSESILESDAEKLAGYLEEFRRQFTARLREPVAEEVDHRAVLAG